MAAGAFTETARRTRAAIGATAGKATVGVLDIPRGLTEKVLTAAGAVPTPAQAQLRRGAAELNKRNALQIVVSQMVAAALLAAFPGEWLFAIFLPPLDPNAHEARASLAVFGALVVAAVTARRNTELVRDGQPPLDLRVPTQLVPWIVLGVAAFVGWLIGISIFR